MKHTLSIVLAAVSVAFSIGMAQAQPVARMGVSPDRYEIDFEASGSDTQALMVQNLSSEPLTIKLSVSNWELDEQNQIALIPPTENSLDQWIVLNPVRITIPPGSPQTIRWAIMPRVQPAVGEYRAMIFLEEDLPPKAENTGNNSVRVKMRYGLPIYAQFGPKTEQAELHEVSTNPDSGLVLFDITNTGNAHSRMLGNYAIWPTAEFPGKDTALSQLRSGEAEAAASNADSEVIAGNMPSTVVLAGARRTITLDPGSAPAESYTLQLDASFADQEITDTVVLRVAGN